MLTPLSSCEAIRENNARTEREYLARQEERSKRARTEAPRVTALQREFAPRMAAQARAAEAAGRAAAKAARAAAKAARALEALNAELREATRMAIGNDYATWHPDGFGDSFLGLASRIVADAARIAVDAKSVTNDAARIAESAEAVVAANE
jgi:hypothetical protein